VKILTKKKVKRKKKVQKVEEVEVEVDHSGKKKSLKEEKVQNIDENLADVKNGETVQGDTVIVEEEEVKREKIVAQTWQDVVEKSNEKGNNGNNRSNFGSGLLQKKYWEQLCEESRNETTTSTTRPLVKLRKCPWEMDSASVENAKAATTGKIAARMKNYTDEVSRANRPSEKANLPPPTLAFAAAPWEVTAEEPQRPPQDVSKAALAQRRAMWSQAAAAVEASPESALAKVKVGGLKLDERRSAWSQKVEEEGRRTSSRWPLTAHSPEKAEMRRQFWRHLEDEAKENK